MKTIINNQTQYPREDYYYGMMEDIRNTFINYGKNLERNNISGYGTIEDYETFLQFQEAQEEEFNVDVYENNPSPKAEDYLMFVDFLIEQEKWQREVIIVTESDWNEFYDSNDLDREMKITAYVQANEFSDKFAEITGIDELKFESCFVSSTYLDTYTYNTMNLIIKINGVNQRFIIDCV